MRSLISLLEEAVRRSAFEVKLESGQPVVYTTARGAEAETSVLPRSDLFDMIVAAVDDAQQVELAVGNPVEFSIDAGDGWTVHAEPGMDGITVHAQRGRALALEIDLDYRVDGIGGGADAADEVAGVREHGLGVPGGSSGVPTPLSRETSDALVLEDPALDVGLLDAPLLGDPVAGGDYGGRGPEPAPASFESGTWALNDDDDLEVGFDVEASEDSLPTGFPEPPRAGYESGEFIGVPEDDDDDDQGVGDGHDPFAPTSAAPDPEIDRRRTLSPTVRAMDASPRPTAPPDARGSSGPARAMAPREPSDESSAQGATRRELAPVASPGAVTLREFPNFGHGESELNKLTANIGEGALVYVREPGFADTLAESFQAPSVIIDDQLDTAEVWTRVRGLPPGAIVIVRCEDPSRLLGWILRRLEEGYRVFLETRARTPEGARRMLLGVSATALGEQWLDRQVTLAIEAAEGGPRLVEC